MTAESNSQKAQADHVSMKMFLYLYLISALKVKMTYRQILPVLLTMTGIVS